MTIRSEVAAILPQKLRLLIGFFSRLSYYYRMDRSNSDRVRNRTGLASMYVTPEVLVHVPQHPNSIEDWMFHSWYPGDFHNEIMDFLELALGSKRLFDIGASHGLLSAIYAAGNPIAEKIVSIEPDPNMFPLLEETMILNGRTGLEWTSLGIAIGDHNGRLTMPLESRMRGLSTASYVNSADVNVLTISELSKNVGYVPDIIKIDIESYEYEALTASSDFIALHKPKLQLELHWELLEGRGKEIQSFLKPLVDLGYRSIRGPRDWQKRRAGEAVSRFSLYA